MQKVMRRSKAKKGNCIVQLQLMMHEHLKAQLIKDPVLSPSGDFFSANTIELLVLTL